MKKSNIFIIVSLLLTLSRTALACGPYYYSAADYHIYRLPSLPGKEYYNFEMRNSIAWSHQTGCRDTMAIYNALYSEWENFGDWESLLQHIRQRKCRMSNPMSHNAFCKHLISTKDSDAVRLLCWSKAYTNIRNSQRSPWYYNSHLESDETKQLRAMYQELLRYKPARKYADRYAFLALKCAWALGEDSAAVALWKRSQLHKKNNLFHYEAGDYAQRCLSRLGRNEEAWAIFNNGDASRHALLDASLPSQLLFLLNACPNDYSIPDMLRSYISSLDVNHAATYHWDDPDDLKLADSIVLVARRAVNNPRVRYKSIWRYSAACVLDYLGKSHEAISFLKGAENGDGLKSMQKAVRTLTFYLRAKTATLDDAFEQYAIGEIKWLDKEMVREWKRMPDNERDKISNADGWHGMFTAPHLQSYESLYRIVLEDSVGLAWRMARAGRGVTALQMANVASNHLFHLSNNTFVKLYCKSNGKVYRVWYDADGPEPQSMALLSLDDTAKIKGEIYSMDFYLGDNSHDYSNGLFRVADILDARTLEAYTHRLRHPRSASDRWFNARSYTGTDYWHDIVGTHFLRQRNYPEAVAHFKRVSPSYQKRMNVSCSIDPFSIDCTKFSTDTTRYKLHFAQRMDSLQHLFSSKTSPDKRGLAMLEYSIGLDNSFHLCWWLTSYCKGHTHSCANLTDIDDTPYALQADTRVQQLRKTALNTLQSNDARARYHLRLGHYSMVRKRYASTPTAKCLALVCDHAIQYRRPGRWLGLSY